MFKKIGNGLDSITPLSKEAVLADPIIIDRMTKLAKDIRSIAPKSDDFLYFSIIFLKAAESSLIDEKGDLKKVGNERAWGYFDESWKWHGNVKPHKNSNSDIFPEIELKKAAHDWIGKPLCKDHVSDSVDGIRGIILDTHYDEKLKQVVGLCALDRVNYADLAKKVETGIVRYGSMGTAVETSVCTECCNRAKTAEQYCDHVKKRSAWGEINVGLKPIEYSLVVQPAEPGAILLKCIASLNNYRQEFISQGVSFEDMITSLSLNQAQHLESIVKTACGDSGCSIEDRKMLITSFLKNNNLLNKTSQNIPSQSINSERFTSHQTIIGPSSEMVSKDDSDVKDYSGTSGSINSSVSEQNTFDPGGVIPEDDYLARTTHTNKTASNENTFSMLSNIMEDIMNESTLNRRAQLREKVAYHQGADGKQIEPNTYKKEKFPHDADKHMKQTKTMGNTKEMFPGDKQIKEKLSRAQLEERRLERLAYFQGGSKDVEPPGYKKQPFPHDADKHMKQTKTMGNTKEMFPGDKQIKEKLSRAAYVGEPLSTKLSWASNSDGSINKSASVFEVYAGNKKVLAASGHEIFGNNVSSEWDWFKSKEYGKEVCKQIRASGLGHVTMLLKGAQQAPATPVMPTEPAGDMGMASDMGAPPPAPPGGDSMDMGADESMDMGMDMGGDQSDLGEENSPKQMVENSLVEVEEAVASARDALSKIEGGGSVNINIDADKGSANVSEGDDEVKLSSMISRQLKVAIAQLDEAGDELAMVSETYENSHRLSDAHVSELNVVAFASVKEASRILGHSSALIKMATGISKLASKSSKSQAVRKFATQYEEDMSETMDNMADDYDNYSVMKDDSHDMVFDDQAPDHADDDIKDDEMDMAHDMSQDDEVSDLISKAMDLRRSRREELVIMAAKKRMDDKKKVNQAKDSDKKKPSKEDAKKEDAKKEDKKKDKEEDGKKQTKKASALNDIVTEGFEAKKAEQDKDIYKLKLRRAYDVAMEMQTKGLIALSKTALDKQVDDIMDFDDKAFEAFKRSVANTRSVNVKKAGLDLGGLNVGVESDVVPSPAKSSVEVLKMLWDK